MAVDSDSNTAEIAAANAPDEIRISFEHVDKVGLPEILVEFYKDKDLQFMSYVSSAHNDGHYDTVNSQGDMDNDGDQDDEDNSILCKLAQTASEMLKKTL